jgi:hypothetical protein
MRAKQSMTPRRKAEVLLLAELRYTTEPLPVKIKDLLIQYKQTFERKSKPHRNLSQKGMAELKAECDKVFSVFIRTRDTDADGFIACCTCGKRVHWKYCDAGHAISRAHLTTRYDEQNVHAQCKQCNLGGGRQADHFAFIERKYGEGTVEQLRLKSHMRHGLTRAKLQSMMYYYRELVKRGV